MGEGEYKRNFKMCYLGFKRLKFSCCLVVKWGPTFFATPWNVTGQSPLSMGFLRQEYWSGLLFPSPGDLPDPGSKPVSPELAGRFFTAEPPGKPEDSSRGYQIFIAVSIICRSIYLSKILSLKAGRTE